MTRDLDWFCTCFSCYPYDNTHHRPSLYFHLWNPLWSTLKGISRIQCPLFPSFLIRAFPFMWLSSWFPFASTTCARFANLLCSQKFAKTRRTAVSSAIIARSITAKCALFESLSNGSNCSPTVINSCRSPSISSVSFRSSTPFVVDPSGVFTLIASSSFSAPAQAPVLLALTCALVSLSPEPERFLGSPAFSLPREQRTTK